MAAPMFSSFGLIILVAFTSFSIALLASAELTFPFEVSALKAVRRKLHDPAGNLDNWKGKDPCVRNWTGVICSNREDGYFHVQELRLLHMNLSGKLAPELGQLLYVTILNFMWNNISGSIPKEIGNMTSLQLLLLSGNQISGPLPDELGYLPNLTKFQLDINFISGELPRSFANLPKVRHFHMNNNSISGQIPPELSALPLLVHFLMDNNNLSGYLPPELSKMPSLKILQVNNNNFSLSEIPDSYGNMSKLLKLSLRNCGLKGSIPDFSSIPGLFYLDLSENQLTGTIPTNRLSNSITTIDLSNNMLNGSIPSNFSEFPHLQKLLLQNNILSGDVPTTIWQNITFSATRKLTLDFRNNSMSDVSGILDPPENVSIKLQGNPVCARANELRIVQFCGLTGGDIEPSGGLNNSTTTTVCPPQSCPTTDNFEYVPASPASCFCAAPIGVGLRLRSPSILDFRPYIRQFEAYMTANLSINLYQLTVPSFMWEEGPRLRMYLKIFPPYSNNTFKFNTSELQRLINMFATFNITGDDTFGPYDLLNFTLLGPYSNELHPSSKSGMKRSTLLGIVIGAIAGIIAVALAFAVVHRKHKRHHREVDRRKSTPKIFVKTEAVKEFSFVELETATRNFSTEVGQGGYGKVYKGILADGTVVAIKRAHQWSLQGQKEFFTEIELLSRLHHRNLVSLLGYCVDEGEQMLVYEFMPNGSLHNLLAARHKRPFSFGLRMQIALASAKGILYLHTEADPPIIHRDIKTNNILLDSKFTAKVADFGISRLVPVSDIEGVASHVSTIVKGTPGYVDPEYFLTHQLTEKSDVYSLGIVFLELLTGMQPISHGKNIVREAQTACESGKMLSIVDKSMGPYPSESVTKFITLALKCCEDETEDRPSTLDVVRELENLILTSSTKTESDTNPSLSEATTSGITGSDSEDPQKEERRTSLMMSSDFLGSDLVSGTMPIIRPR